MLTERLIKQGYYGKALNEKLKYQADHYVLLKGMMEILPDRDNRVMLSKTEKDAWGLPRIEVHYKFPEYVHKGYDHSIDVYKEIASAMGGTEVVFSKRGVYDNNQHITGTLSMGADPATSVVDRDLRSHEHENLFMAGTGVMPTAAIVNSTLTGTALALRTADTVLKSLA